MDELTFTTALEHIIARDRSAESYAEYACFRADDMDAIVEVIRKTLTSIPSAFGSCVMVSTGLIAALRAQGIPGIVVLGDLLVNGGYVFQCVENIPVPTYDGEVIDRVWDGHAWAMVGGYIMDLSLFRSAYAIDHPSRLKSFILDNFGTGRGALISTLQQLPTGMTFVPRYALDDSRICGVLQGLSAQSKSLRGQSK